MFLKINFREKIKKVAFKSSLKRWKSFEPALKEILQIPQNTSLKIYYIDPDGD